MYLDLETIERLLSYRFKEGFVSLSELPHPFTLHGMQRAVTRIVEAVQQREKIALVGDYDVDGVISTALICDFFEALNYPIEAVIPNRFSDGYGISEKVIERLDSPDLIITVDNGIGAHKAARLAKERGIDLIITDHHLPSETLPDAYVIVDPKQAACSFAYEDICGAQVAWYLIAALRKALGCAFDLKEALSLVAIAVIADMMPLRGINRTMVERGLAALSRSDRPFVRAYRAYREIDRFESEQIAFWLAPLLNSAGRIADAKEALAFVRAKSVSEATEALQRLLAYNEERKALESRITQEALAMLDTTRSVAVLSDASWHEGVVGIVASRVARKSKKPTLILCEDEEGGLKGSGRSNGSCHLFRLLQEAEDLLEGFGGHRAAVGLRLKKVHLKSLYERLDNAYASGAFDDSLDEEHTLGALAFETIDERLMALLRRFEPYGTGNAKPHFITEGVEVLSAKRVGKDQAHLKLFVRHGTRAFDAIAFSCDQTPQVGERIALRYSLSLNRFRGNETIQLLIDEIL